MPSTPGFLHLCLRWSAKRRSVCYGMWSTATAVLVAIVEGERWGTGERGRRGSSDT